MTDLRVTLRLESPLSAGTVAPGREAPGSIPATTLRGALAWSLEERARWGDQGAAEAMRALFHDPSAITRWTNAHPPGDPLPRTAMTCKVRSGFRPRNHGVFDTLLDFYCWSVQRPPTLVYQPVCSQQPCQEPCRVYGGTPRGELAGAPRPVLLRSGVALSRRRQAAEPGLLFTTRVVPERDAACHPVTFTARITCRDDLAELLGLSLRQVERVGGGSSRGLGRVTVEVAQDQPGESQEGLEGRLVALRSKLLSRWSDWRQMGGAEGDEPDPNALYFTLGLRSPGLFGARHRPRQGPEAEVAEALGMPVALLYASVDTRQVRGWNDHWGLPRPVEQAVDAGASYLFSTRAPLDALAAGLRRLAGRGLGRRVAEGFGEVAVCDPIHYQAPWETPL